MRRLVSVALVLLTGGIVTTAFSVDCPTLFDTGGATMEEWVAPALWDVDMDLNENGMLDKWECALLTSVLCDSGSHPHKAAAVAAYDANVTGMEACAAVWLFGYAGLGELFSGFCTMSQDNIDFWSTGGGAAVDWFDGCTLAAYHTSPTEPFSPEGDLDGDTQTNQEEYDAVVGASGTIADYIAAAGGGDGYTGEVPPPPPYELCPILGTFDLGGAALYTLAAIGAENWPVLDLLGNGIVDADEFALLAWGLCTSPNQDLIDVFEANKALTDTWWSGYPGLSELFAGYVTMEYSNFTAFVGWALLDPTWVMASYTNTPSEPYSPTGDLDGDGVSNLDEYNNVMGRGGTREEYVFAATHAWTDGSSAVPLAGIIGIGVLATACAVGGVTVIRKKRS
jgi:hypothetical protein